MRLIHVCANDILSGRNRIVGQAIFVDSVAVRVRELFIVGAIAFDRALVAIGIGSWLRRVVAHRLISFASPPSG